MALIDIEQDEAEVLAAEDAAIATALHPPAEPVIPTGGTLADMIASLSNGDPTPLHEG